MLRWEARRLAGPGGALEIEFPGLGRFRGHPHQSEFHAHVLAGFIRVRRLGDEGFADADAYGLDLGFVEVETLGFGVAHDAFAHGFGALATEIECGLQRFPRIRFRHTVEGAVVDQLGPLRRGTQIQWFAI